MAFKPLLLLLGLALAGCGGSREEDQAAAAEAYLANVQRQESVNAAQVEEAAKVRDERVMEASEERLERSTAERK